MDCATCKKPFFWFSGCLDQRCGDCQIAPIVNKGAVKMTKKELEKKLLDMEVEIAALKARPQCFGHFCSHTCNPCNHFPTVYPPYAPFYPQPTWCGTTTITYSGANATGNTLDGTTSTGFSPGSTLS